ncbi:hypothetical protein BH10ACT7_BH10ACT7_24690 [soil metagenome]
MANIMTRRRTTAPSTHALVIGVSDYPFADGPRASEFGESMGISNLSSAARAASDVADWLLSEYANPDAPLGSLRVLLAPARGEKLNKSISARVAGRRIAATRAAVQADLKAFREACRANEDNVGIVYVAGHGIQLNKRGAVVLLTDFGDPRHLNELDGAIDVVGCHNAMDEAGTARTQIWFSDACRQLPDVARRFETLTGALTLSEGNGRADASPMFLAASTRESAFAEKGKSTLFARCLLDALRATALVGPDDGCPVWHVGSSQLGRVLPAAVRSAAAAHGEDQTVDIMGSANEVILQRFDRVPHVEIVVELDPGDVTPAPDVTLQFGGNGKNLAKGKGWPLKYRGPAGLYLLDIDARPPLRAENKILDVMPPAHHTTVEVR